MDTYYTTPHPRKDMPIKTVKSILQQAGTNI
ncbi:MAG: type II toxin-antitoxin system HicA family toxin [Thermotaleaceae bacterium]